MLTSVRAALAITLAVLPGFVSGQTPAAAKVNTISIGSDGIVHILHSGGVEFIAPKEKEQVSTGSSSIADDKSAAGWLVFYENCCTSYPIPLGLLVYSAYSEACRSAFRNDVDQHSEVVPISIPN